ncbi:NUDIX hydrolase [Rhizobium sp. C4]|uniref:NUDIX hydrolase n=1 Tax=Rhizobium sp. C4 TaxID=1349800 RepID=UPI001E5650D0|nr:NUDIX domain-containing protein [Rhizobium sp. C4]MCD2171926.1 NUDIX domain-containing protein [Rhizobium sp. C4]
MTTQLKPASSAIVIDGDRYLLIRRANPPAQDLFAFPGGRAEPGETPAETALRELEEETGLKAYNPRLFATYELPGRSGGGFFLSVFLVNCEDIRDVRALEDALEAGWYSAAELATIAVPDSVADCIARLEVWRLGTMVPEI